MLGNPSITSRHTPHQDHVAADDALDLRAEQVGRLALLLGV